MIGFDEGFALLLDVLTLGVATYMIRTGSKKDELRSTFILLAIIGAAGLLLDYILAVRV